MVREEATKCFLKTTAFLLDADGHVYLSLIFVKVQLLQIVLTLFWMGRAKKAPSANFFPETNEGISP